MSGFLAENALMRTPGSAREPTGANGKGSGSFDFLGFTLNLGIRDDTHFEAANPTDNTRACLRLASLATETVTRLATGSGGVTLGSVWSRCTYYAQCRCSVRASAAPCRDVVARGAAAWSRQRHN